MAKIGTAHIEIKPVLNEEALAAIMQRVEDAVAEGVARGMGRSQRVTWNAGSRTSVSGTAKYTPDGE